ncbi:MAG: hypothetical protein FRX48_02072 [Lasallia pustulata]|uniref:Uncharacterized protein n=1 Tax=Lasallia pustulata TaxID=136370 RepID=A0A5M8PWC0_9LECA|nr:MAG: hypothetical protein FRX48_02072 [Lasallia pustulata]
MAPNFTVCGETFSRNSGPGGMYQQYVYNGTVHGIFAQSSKPPPLITYEGCKALCTSGNEYYAWAGIANTITTWILPIVGMLLQAPWESNQFRQTLLALVRWVGSPIASLSYILWNIKVTGKCAMIVDMATRYEDVPGPESEFANLRDSMHILSVMNQYSTRVTTGGRAAEKLLRIALFSNSLQLSAEADEERSSLVMRRQKLAKVLREGRRRGVVPVFISVMWFLFSLGISIQSAFGQLGANHIAHDLALGLLLAWLPVLILCSIVDRNPAAADSTRLKLNRLLDRVRIALLDRDLRHTLQKDLASRSYHDLGWTQELESDDYSHGEFFTRFAGQGRKRFHYGVAQPILAGSEATFMADRGRNWLQNAQLARTELILGEKKSLGLRSFDFRELWQILSATILVFGTAAGAFIISFSTPTVGLSCRSGGYMIFVILAVVILLIELFVWWFLPEGVLPDSRTGDWLRRHSTNTAMERIVTGVVRKLERVDSGSRTLEARNRTRKLLNTWKALSARDQLEVVMFRPYEIVSTGWLCYIIFAQTVGSYQNCGCMSSSWTSLGGYIDFEDYAYYRSAGVVTDWATGTALSCCIMSIGLAFIVAEWCSQSHLSTQDYEKASRGLRRTRWFKKHTAWFRDIPEVLIELALKFRYHLVRGRAERPGRRSLVWTWKTKKTRPEVFEEPISHGSDEERDPFFHNPKGSGNPTFRLQTLQPSASGYLRVPSINEDHL